MGSSGGWRATVRRRCQTDRNAMSNNEGVIANQNVFDDQSHDSLAFQDIKRIGSVSQSSQKGRESLRQAQEHGAIVETGRRSPAIPRAALVPVVAAKAYAREVVQVIRAPPDRR